MDDYKKLNLGIAFLCLPQRGRGTIRRMVDEESERAPGLCTPSKLGKTRQGAALDPLKPFLEKRV